MKKLFVIFAVTGFLFAGCSQSEVEEVSSTTPEAIKISATTSRATVTDLAALKAATGGFQVYASTADNATGWYSSVAGLNNYKWTTSAWGWVSTPTPEWPTTASSYPMTFYAMYPSGVNITATNLIAPATTIAPLRANQVDMIAAKATAANKPGDGMLQLTFDHILSKVNFGIITGTGMTVNVQKLVVNNVRSTASYDYGTGAWGNYTTATADYSYFEDAIDFVTTVADESTPNPIYTTTAATNHLILMPQTGLGTAWDKTVAGIDTHTYIEVFYRIEGATESYIGYDLAMDFVDKYPTYPNTTGWGTYTKIGYNAAAGEYNGGLYVRAGFPVTISWVKGQGYVYNIYLGTASSTNGKYLDDTFYDDDGIDTGIKIPSPTDPDTPVVPGEDVTKGTIDFDIIVNPFAKDIVEDL